MQAHARDATIIVGFTTTRNSGTQELPLNHSTTATLGTEVAFVERLKQE